MERIRLMNPDPAKRGPNIERETYDLVRAAVLDVLRERGEVEFMRDLPRLVAERLPHFQGSVGWYTTSVKLDLEARGEIERVPGVKPQRLRIKE